MAVEKKQKRLRPAPIVDVDSFNQPMRPKRKKGKKKTRKNLVPPFFPSLKDKKRPQKKFDVTGLKSVKVIGRPIGASDEIVDGDGDGFYTPFPGAGDKTPVPASELAKETFDFGGEAVKAFKRMRSEVEEEFGEIKTYEQTRNALRKAFPNAVNPRVGKSIFREEGEAMGPHDTGAAIGLLFMAKKYPEAAKRVRRVADDTPKIDGQEVLGYTRLRMTGDGGFGIQVAISSNSDGLMGAYSTNVTHFSRIGPDAREQGLLDGEDPADSLEALVSAYVAVHEMGHVVHHDAILKDLKVDLPNDDNSWKISDYEGDELWQDPMPFLRAALGWNDFDQRMAEDFAKKFARKKILQLGIDKYDEDSQYERKYRMFFMEGLAAHIKQQNAMDGMFGGSGEDPRERAFRNAGRDGLTDAEVEKARDRFAELGEYADSNLQEGIAEAIAALEMGYPLGNDPAVKKLLAWMGVQVKRAKGRRRRRESPALDIGLCGGLVKPSKEPYRLLDTP